MNKLLSAFVLQVLFTFAVFKSSTEATNKYPIVLVHGLGGWSRGEFFGAPYWGTLQGNFHQKLKADGYLVYAVGIGKFSSNWDRACELYAEIKGGRVDYGLNHSQIHGHARYGRTYPGLFRQWGTVVNGTLQKVHLMGHSMGGETIRMLAQLLNKGAGDALTVEAPDTHELFAGGKDWVHSITTISAPNQGTTLADMLADHIDLIENVSGLVAGAVGLPGSGITSFYNPNLDQWGVQPRQPDETVGAYTRRIMSSKMFAPGYLDNAGFSLTVSGSTSENSWVTTLPNIYYYSFVTEATIPSKDSQQQTIALPDKTIMNPLVVPLAKIMGSRDTSKLGFSDEWLPNDGFVNVISQGSDGVGKVNDFNGNSERGAWTRFKTMRMDHLGMMGIYPQIQVYDVYKAHAALVSDLPSQEEGVEDGAGGHQAAAVIVEAVNAAFEATTVPEKDNLANLTRFVGDCVCLAVAIYIAKWSMYLKSSLIP